MPSCNAHGHTELVEVEATPGQSVLTAVLSSRTWSQVPGLRGIIGAPVLRRDGTLLQQPGYDAATV